MDIMESYEYCKFKYGDNYKIYNNTMRDYSSLSYAMAAKLYALSNKYNNERKNNNEKME